MSADHQARSRASGERLTDKIKSLAGVRSVLLTHDEAAHDDAGLLVLWDTEPPAGDEDELLDGVEFRITHRRVATVDQWIADVIGGADPDLVKQHLIATIRDGVVLHDTGLIPAWTARTGRYPDELASAMVRAHLNFRSSGQRSRMLERGDLLPLAQDRLDTARNVLLVLFGLNRIWFAHPGFAGVSRLAESLPLAPAGLPARLDALFTATPASSVPAADALISETLILIARHLPDAGAATALARLSRFTGRA
ncbi:DUF4037 domain-containing protein [Actinoplanes derwentensis]|uniref:DUF4037 domain-containing protein n=1 Tax=Actinoplanes derwentensis TaxID=113562 RepID=A0A1H2AEP0_9ACTN|nr:DUF4037 domain-containing protein [Actinoplanes derwentensis]GID88238.1 hypothetical protein Ade03nite_71620 [Actinoplanes derwentensis]SDT44423.1 protein of unknown function [Actinoplanes derwentensis]